MAELTTFGEELSEELSEPAPPPKNLPAKTRQALARVVVFVCRDVLFLSLAAFGSDKKTHPATENSRSRAKYNMPLEHRLRLSVYHGSRNIFHHTDPRIVIFFFIMFQIVVKVFQGDIRSYPLSCTLVFGMSVSTFTDDVTVQNEGKNVQKGQAATVSKWIKRWQQPTPEEERRDIYIVPFFFWLSRRNPE